MRTGERNEQEARDQEGQKRKERKKRREAREEKGEREQASERTAVAGKPDGKATDDDDTLACLAHPRPASQPARWTRLNWR